jgi:hypothetical protein
VFPTMAEVLTWYINFRRRQQSGTHIFHYHLSPTAPV